MAMFGSERTSEKTHLFKKLYEGCSHRNVHQFAGYANEQQTRASVSGRGSIPFIGRRVILWPPAVNCVMRRLSPLLDLNLIAYFRREKSSNDCYFSGISMYEASVKQRLFWAHISVFVSYVSPQKTRRISIT
jgi:hypothetical protein